MPLMDERRNIQYKQYMPLMDERNTQYRQCSKTSQDLHLQQNTVLMGIKKISKFNLLSV